MNLSDKVNEQIRQSWDANVRLAIVTGTSGNKVTVRWIEEAGNAGTFARLLSYASPTAADEVLCMKVGGGSWIVLGKVTK